MHESIVFSQGGYPIGHREPDRSYWAVKLNNGVWLCEMDTVDARVDKWLTTPDASGLRSPIDLLPAKRNLDWTLDLVSTGDVARITELWLICPPSVASPSGNIARLPITRPGTAFQLKVGFVDSSIGMSVRNMSAQMIGRVTDGETGDAEVFCFDYEAQTLIVHQNGSDNDGKPLYGPWKTNVFNMGTWRPSIPGTPSIAPIGRLSLGVLGLHLGESA